MSCCATTCGTQAEKTERRPAEAITSPKVHVHLHAVDFAAAVDFYRTFLGTEPVKLKQTYAKFLPGWAPLNLAISQDSVPDRGHVVDHIGVQLASPEAVRQHIARLRAAGIALREEMGVDCCYANQDEFWVVDPSGVEWEVYHLNADIDDATEKPTSTSACCAN